MNLSVTLVCVWVVAAAVLSMLPSQRHHWPLAYVLIAVGLPLLAYVFYENGPVYGFGALLVGCLVLRWPVIYLGRWIARKFGA